MVSSEPNPFLEDENSLSEPKNKDPRRMWIFIFVFILIITILWGLGTWQEKLVLERRREDPFLNVTNRDFSLFLWQNPEFMRAHALHKIGYLSAFRSEDNVHLIKELADEYVDAPVEVLFRYHVWNFLLEKESLFNRAISVREFKEFLHDCPEWQPEYWPYKNNLTVKPSNAPAEYIAFITSLNNLESGQDLTKLPLDVLPFKVRLAFQGWKNFFKESSEIQNLKISITELEKFLKDHKNYTRSYWKNILESSIPDYLKNIEKMPKEENVPYPELSYFLKIALYNSI